MTYYLCKQTKHYRGWNQDFHIATYSLAPNILWGRMCCKEKTTLFFLLMQIIW